MGVLTLINSHGLVAPLVSKMLDQFSLPCGSFGPPLYPGLTCQRPCKVPAKAAHVAIVGPPFVKEPSLSPLRLDPHVNAWVATSGSTACS